MSAAAIGTVAAVLLFCVYVAVAFVIMPRMLEAP